MRAGNRSNAGFTERDDSHRPNTRKEGTGMEERDRKVASTAQTADLRLKIVYVPIDDLHLDPGNPRRISDLELDALTQSIKTHGFVHPVLARREDHMVIAGHQRLVGARRLGLKVVPVVFVDNSRELAQLLNIASNRVGGAWDGELLGRRIEELLAIPNVDLSLSGLTDDEIDKYLKLLQVREKADRLEVFDLEGAFIDAERKTPRTKRGDLWLLGDHRLFCGDATNEEDVGQLMGEKKAALMATDPPYLVDYQGGNHPASKANKDRPNKDKHWDSYVDPDTSVEFFVNFLKAALTHLAPNSAIYQWHAHRRQALVERAWTECGLLIHQQIIWVKARGVLTHSHYLWRHEPCFGGWPEGQTPKLKPPPDESTVWQINQAGEQMGIHPTQKPVELFMKPISFHTQANDICYEPFLGPGTQLIACERLGRRCYALELEPHYVDIAVARWEAFSGEKAIRQAE